MNYQLNSSGLLIVDVPSSSSLDNPHVAQQRRGTVHRTLTGNVVQYMEPVPVGDTGIVWTIPLADSNQYGRLYSASIGVFGDALTFVSPVWGSIAVAFEPGENAFKPQKLQPMSFGYQIEITFVRLV